MWRVERRPGAAHGTLFIVVGMGRVECGVLLGRGLRARWVEETLQEAAVPAGAVGEQAIKAVRAVVQNLQSLAALPRIAEVRVVVADAWLALASAPWSSSFRRASTAVGSARTHLTEAGFDIESADTIRVDDAPFEQPRLAVAYPAPMLATFGEVARRFDARLSSVLTLSSVAWAVTEREARIGHGSRQQALAVLDCGLTIFARPQGRRDGRLSGVTVRREGNDRLTVENLSAAWSRLGLRDPHLSQVDKVAVLDLCGPTDPTFKENATFITASLPASGVGAAGFTVSSRLLLASQTAGTRYAIDAVMASAKPSPWQWLGLTVAVLFAGALGAGAIQVHRARDALVAVSSVEPVIAQPTAPTAAWTRDELVRVQAANGAIRELNLPIASILLALQPPRDIRVAVVSVDARGASSESQVAGSQMSSVKVVAEAPSSADMARYVAFVGERTPFIAAYLVGHEINDAAPEKPYRFTIDAMWAER